MMYLNARTHVKNVNSIKETKMVTKKHPILNPYYTQYYCDCGGKLSQSQEQFVRYNGVIKYELVCEECDNLYYVDEYNIGLGFNVDFNKEI